MGDRFRLGIVGCGEMSMDFARVCGFNRRVSIRACADITPERTALFMKRYHTPSSYGDYREMIDKESLDAVYLGVPHHLHYPMMKDILERGLHIFCEKPVTTRMDQAVEICRLAKSRGLKVGVNYQYRYDSACYRLAMAARGGALGGLYYGRCNVPWFRDRGYFDRGPWRGRVAESGGGTLLTQASHALDILLWAMGGRPVAAQGMTARRKFRDVEVEDVGMGIIELDTGAVLSVTGSMAAVPEQKVTIEVYGEKGTGLYRGPDYPPFSKVRFEGIKVRREKMPVRGIFSFSRSIEAFRRWVADDVPFLCSVENSLPVLAAVLAVYKSAETGKKERIDPDSFQQIK